MGLQSSPGGIDQVAQERWVKTNKKDNSTVYTVIQSQKFRRKMLSLSQYE